MAKSFTAKKRYPEGILLTEAREGSKGAEALESLTFLQGLLPCLDGNLPENRGRKVPQSFVPFEF